MLLDHIQSPADLKGLNNQQLKKLAKEIRAFMIDHLSKTGGHVSSNLGIVELTLAIDSVFDPPQDKLVWDVGHQAYVHKILTGRKDDFDALRQEDGLSGFTRIYESEYDLFNSGHASNSISLAYGLAKARDLKKESGEVVAIIGDGALTGGLAYEALNNAGKGESKVIIILNDNEMSIGHNVGRIAHNLSRIRTRKGYQQTKVDIKQFLVHMPLFGQSAYRVLSRLKKRFKYFLLNGVFFEEMGFVYLGPVDGHNIADLRKVLKQAKQLEDSVVIHVRTSKGKGYTPAERDPSRFHGIGAFDPKTGESRQPAGCRTWSDVFGETMLALARSDRNVAAVSAAMVDGTGLSDFERFYPERMFDVGIAEEHAVTFAAGLAKGGLKPVVAIYSTFLQRAYDQIVHDVCLNNLPVVLAVDRAGIVGEDGESHQGIYDLSYLSHIPGMTVMAPSSAQELQHMLTQALSWNRPCAIRYPRGKVITDDGPVSEIVYGKAEVRREGRDIAIVALGPCVEMAEKAAERLLEKGIHPTVVNARFAYPLDQEMLHSLAHSHSLIVTVEDHIVSGGFGEAVTTELADEAHCLVKRIGIPDIFVPQGSRESLLQRYGISPEGIVQTILEAKGKGA